MLTDCELLERAAKAVGIKIVRITDTGMPLIIGKDENGKHWDSWNPLTDDGDALRLAVKLGMDFFIYLPTDREAGMTYVNTKELLGYGTDGYRAYQCSACNKEEHGADPYAATRRAIVRAAAEIGKEMK